MRVVIVSSNVTGRHSMGADHRSWVLLTSFFCGGYLSKTIMSSHNLYYISFGPSGPLKRVDHMLYFLSLSRLLRDSLSDLR